MTEQDILEDMKMYFKNLKEWDISLEWVFDFYLPCGCDYEKLREYGIKNNKDLQNDKKYANFIGTYIAENYKKIAENVRDNYRFSENKIVYKRTFTDEKGITRPYLVDVFHTDRIDRTQQDAIYYFAIGKFGRPPEDRESRSQQQARLRKERAEYKDLEGLYEIEEIKGYTFEK